MVEPLLVTRLQHRLAADEGITVPELMIATLIIGLVMATVGGLMSGLLRDWHIQEALASVEEETRPVVREMLVQVRQSVQSQTGSANHPVSEMAWNKLVVYADRLGDTDDAPERHVYELVDCSAGANGGLCALQLTVTAPDNPGDAANWTYTGAPLRVDRLLENVLAEPPTDDDGGDPTWLESEVDDSLFYMVRWDPVPGGDPVRTILGACVDGGAQACDGNLVVISLQVDPSTVKEFPAIFELYEEVRLRNA
jgi:hypothetical protein